MTSSALNVKGGAGARWLRGGFTVRELSRALAAAYADGRAAFGRAS